MTHRKRRRRAWLAIASWAITFVLLQAGLVLAIDNLSPALRDASYGLKAMRFTSRAKASPPDTLKIVVMGSSHVAYGFSPRLPDRNYETILGERYRKQVIIYNMGIYGSGPLRDLLMLRRMLAQGLKPDVLVIEVVPMFTANQNKPGVVKETELISGDTLSAEEIDLMTSLGVPRDALMHGYWERRLMPWYGYRFNLLSLTMPRLLPAKLRRESFVRADECGALTITRENTDQTQRKEAIAQTKHLYIGMGPDFEFGGPSIAALPVLLDLCRDQGITVALLIMPEGSGIRELYADTVWPQIQSHIDGLCANYHIPLIDARSTWLQDSDLSDMHHALDIGQWKFTVRLCDEALPPLIEKALAARKAPPPATQP